MGKNFVSVLSRHALYIVSYLIKCSYSPSSEPHSSHTSGSSALSNEESAILIMPHINVVDIVVLRSHVQILAHVSCSDLFLGVLISSMNVWER
jgi:1-acyl-sn-glycerol-3-phosphate acyltransferase